MELDVGDNVLFQGLTRPTMVWGIPFEAYLVCVFVGALFFLLGGLVYLLTIPPMLLICRIIAAYDPRMFELLGLWAQTKATATTRGIWQCSSYSPFTPTRKANGKIDHENLPIFV